MADNDQKIEALDDLIASGTKSAFVDGDRIEFQSTADLIRARNHAAKANASRRLRPILLRLPRLY